MFESIQITIIYLYTLDIEDEFEIKVDNIPLICDTNNVEKKLQEFEKIRQINIFIKKKNSILKHQPTSRLLRKKK